MSQQKTNEFLKVNESTDLPGIEVVGDWILAHYLLLERQINQLPSSLSEKATVDLSQLQSLDTAGAALLVKLLGEQRLEDLDHIAPMLPIERRVLLKTVGRALQGFIVPPVEKPPGLMIELLANIGRAVDDFWQNMLALFGFIGLTLIALCGSVLRPSRWRLTSLVANIQQIGLNAVPIVILLTFLVGAVIAFLGSTVLATFGAGIFTVHLVVFSFLREFAVLLTAILIAGRTASAFTAQIGLMKANEEIDAIQTLGLDPVELLVLPRVLALLVVLPILTFIGMVSGIFGGAMVCALTLDISPNLFLTIMQSNAGVQHFLVGMSKAPLFAFLIAIIGCLEGFKVTGSAASVGEHTTASVVHSIFVVILLNAVAALFFMEMGW